MNFTIGFSRLGVAQRIGKCLRAPGVTQISTQGTLSKSVQLEALKGIAGAYEGQPLSKAPTLPTLTASSGFNNEVSLSATAIVVAYRYMALRGGIAVPAAIRESVNEKYRRMLIGAT